MNKIALKNNNFNIISKYNLFNFSIKHFTIPYTPKNIPYNRTILIGKKKKPIIVEAMYTKKALFIEPLIIAIGIINEANVRMLNVFMGINKFKYKIMLVSATKTALRAISFDFII
jgi:hypothetical protein